MPFSRGGHARREEIARAKGFPSYRAYRQASEAERLAATQQLARDDESYKGRPAEVERAARQPGQGAKQVHRTPAGDVVVTFNTRTVLSNLKRWGTRPVKVSVDTSDGIQHQLFGKYGWRADNMRASVLRDDDGNDRPPPVAKHAVLDWLNDYVNRSQLGELYELGDLVKVQFVAVARGSGQRAA